VPATSECASIACRAARAVDRRAKTVYNFLIKYGVDASRLTFRGYGESMPIADNATAEGRATNRRVELRVVKR